MKTSDKIPPIFINCGDPNGIGPEVSLKALAHLGEAAENRVVLAGSFTALTALNRLLGEPLQLQLVTTLQSGGETAGIPVVEPSGAPGFEPAYGEVSAAAGAISGHGIEMGVRACLKKEAAALITAPSSKEALHLAGFEFSGQTEMIAHLAGAFRYIMILFVGARRVGLYTTHLPLSRIARVLNKDALVDKISTFRETLIKRFDISDPKIAVTSLNPHASNGGIFGDEEERIIIPAIDEANRNGVQAEGPFPADTIFPRWENYDGILAMYHDQGMIAIKMAGFGKAVNTTGGLPFPRTSPDHGTAFDIAGQLRADPGSMVEAVKAALTFSQTARITSRQS
jgi:4-hydroxythreonine-4-phosphate dehydrogenase